MPDTVLTIRTEDRIGTIAPRLYGHFAEHLGRCCMSSGSRVEDETGLGTHEFFRLCALLGAEPYLAGNVGSGSPQELCDWLEYCNTPVNTSLARERAANGSPEPFNVRLGGVGNENGGCGGNRDAGFYPHKYRRYATML